MKPIVSPTLIAAQAYALQARKSATPDATVAAGGSAAGKAKPASTTAFTLEVSQDARVALDQLALRRASKPQGLGDQSAPVEVHGSYDSRADETGAGRREAPLAHQRFSGGADGTTRPGSLIDIRI